MSTLVPSVGKAVISGRMFGATPTQAEPHYMGWGTGTGGVAGTTNLITPASEARVSGTSSQVTSTSPAVTNDTHQVVATITATASKTITEVGIFDAVGSGSPPSGGVLYAYFDGFSQALNNGDSIQFTAKITFT